MPFFSIFTTPISARRLRRESFCFSRAVGAQKTRCQRRVLEIFTSTAQNGMLSCTFWVLVASGAWLWLQQRCWGRGRARDGEMGDKGQHLGWVLGAWVFRYSNVWTSDAQISDLGCWEAQILDLGCWDAQISNLGRWEAQMLGSWMFRSQIFRFLEARMLRSQILDAGKLRSWMLGCRAEAGHLWEGEFKPTAACKCKITRAASPWDGIWHLLGGQNLWSKARGRLGLWRTLSRGCRCAGTSRQRSQELSQLLHVTAALCVCCSRPPRAAARPSGGR